jgi:hypothetical protein
VITSLMIEANIYHHVDHTIAPSPITNQCPRWNLFPTLGARRAK